MKTAETTTTADDDHLPTSPSNRTVRFAAKALNADDVRGCGGSPYLTTPEAARYLRKSPSWLLKRPDIPFLKSVPNIYKKKDLDDWFERNKFEPSIN